MRSAGLDVELDDRVGAGDLPTTTGLTAYRVIQEALTNAGKYGLGTARVVLQEDGAMLHIEVSNQVAAPAAATAPAGAPGREGATGHAGGPQATGQMTGHGLIGMRERVAAAGGTISVTSGAVFQIRVDLPLHRVTR
jgi:signal transduction histidine kinase